MLETQDSIYTVASGKTFEEVIKVASEAMTNLLMEKIGLNFPDAYRLLSATCDIQISQVVNGIVTIRVRAHKLHLGIQELN